MRRFFLLLIVLSMAGCSRSIGVTPSAAPTLELATSTPVPLPSATPYVQTFPIANPDLLLFSTRIQAIRVADDDGQNMANITPD